MKEERELLVNSIKCPDGTILKSTFRHDYKEHTQADGRVYFVDGGLDYQRIGHSDTEYKDLTIYTDDPHSIIRELFTWGSIYDAKGKPLKEIVFRKLKDLDNKHIKVLCYFTLKGYPEKINKVFVDEHNYRLDTKS